MAAISLSEAVDNARSIAKLPYLREEEQARVGLLSTQAEKARMNLETEKDTAASRLALRAKGKEVAEANVDIDLSTHEGSISYFNKMAEDPEIRNDPEKMAFIRKQKEEAETSQATSFKSKAAIVEDKQTIAFDALQGAFLSGNDADWNTAIANAPDERTKRAITYAKTTMTSPGFQALSEDQKETFMRNVSSKIAPLKAAAAIAKDVANLDFRRDQLAQQAERDKNTARYNDAIAAARQAGVDSKSTQRKLEREKLLLSYEKELIKVEKDTPEVPNPAYKEASWLSKEGTFVGDVPEFIPNPKIAELQADIKKLKQGTILDVLGESDTGELDPNKVLAKDGKTYTRPASMSNEDWEEYKQQVGK